MPNSKLLSRKKKKMSSLKTKDKVIVLDMIM